MSVYSFRMTWEFEAPVDGVWEMITNPEQWPTVWKNCKNVEKLRDPDANGVGGVQRFSMQTQLPYTLRFTVTSTRSEPPNVLAGDVSGQLQGTVRWELSQTSPEITTIRYFWEVEPTRAWMRAVSPLLRPVFVWNHRSMMRNAARGLSQMIDARLVAEEYA
jgi:carbon monoxide dehydrogenase subunit G